MRATRSLIALGLATLCGCYTYEPASIADIRPEMRVRARLSTEELARLGSVLPTDGRLIEGEVLERSEGEMLLLVPITTDVVGARVQTLHQRLRVPDQGVIEVEARRLDRFKTGIVLGASIAAAAGIATAALAGGFRSDRPGDGGNPADLVIPIGFSIPFGR